MFSRGLILFGLGITSIVIGTILLGAMIFYLVSGSKVLLTFQSIIVLLCIPSYFTVGVLWIKKARSIFQQK
jgi:hypothetical protein